MEVSGRHIIITGGGSGIGRAMARRFAAEGARAVVVADVDGDAAEAVAADIGGMAVRTDVSCETDIITLVSRAIDANGPVDLMCSNAGISGPSGGPEIPNDAWQQIWQVNVMAHVWAARAVLPGMLARGEGCLINTASAAGLLTNLGLLSYTVSKHAAVGLAEWLSIAYGDRGIKVFCLCPLAVRTPLVAAAQEDPAGATFVAAAGVMLEPDDVAEAVMVGLRDERFLILPHPEVATYLNRKSNDSDRWLASMRRVQAQMDSHETHAVRSTDQPAPS